MARDTISTRQCQVLEYIAEYSELNGYPPSVRDIGEHVGLASPSTVFTHLTSLERKGFIKKQKDSARAIIILPKGWEVLGKTEREGAMPAGILANDADRLASFEYNAIELPLVGQVAAGEPILAEQNIDDYFTLPKQVVGENGSFMLTIKGDSMIEAGINDGDYVVVKQQPTADNGDIVVAMIGDDATVKTFYKEKDSIRLQPQNSSMEPIYSRDVQVIGKVVALLRAM